MEKHETDPDDQTEETSAPPAGVASEEMKVVVTMKGRKAIISVGSPDCDPLIQMVEVQGEGDPLLGAIATVPQIAAEARTRWATAKRYPIHQAPPPPPATARAPTARVATSLQVKTTTTTKGKPPETVQQTLPLL